MPEEWRDSIIVIIYDNGVKTDCSNYRGISFLSPTKKILSNILLSRLTPHAQEIIGYHQCGFRRNRSITDRIPCISKVLEKEFEYSQSAPQICTDFKKAYDSVRGRSCITSQ